MTSITEIYSDFFKDKKKSPRITNCYKNNETVIYYNAHRPRGKEYVLGKNQYNKIIKRVNELLIEQLLLGETIIFPCGMGRVQIGKSILPMLKMVGDKLENYKPIDWKSTLKLWHEDKESRDRKLLLRFDVEEVFKIIYNKNKSTYKNKFYFKFQFNRLLKTKLKEYINNGKLIDAFNLNKTYGEKIY